MALYREVIKKNIGKTIARIKCLGSKTLAKTYRIFIVFFSVLLYREIFTIKSNFNHVLGANECVAVFNVT